MGKRFECCQVKGFGEVKEEDDDFQIPFHLALNDINRIPSCMRKVPRFCFFVR